MTGIDLTIRKLGEAFATICRREFTDAQMLEIRRRNASSKYAGACATHDFADANMIMDEAFTEVMGRSFLPDEGEPTDADVALWNAAWDYARKIYLTEFPADAAE